MQRVLLIMWVSLLSCVAYAHGDVDYWFVLMWLSCCMLFNVVVDVCVIVVVMMHVGRELLW